MSLILEQKNAESLASIAKSLDTLANTARVASGRIAMAVDRIVDALELAPNRRDALESAIVAALVGGSTAFTPEQIGDVTRRVGDAVWRAIHAPPPAKAAESPPEP